MEMVYVIPKEYKKGKPVDRFEKEHKFGSYVLSKKQCKELGRELTIIPLLKDIQNNLNDRFSKSTDPALFLNNSGDSFVVIDEKMIDIHENIYAFIEKKDAFDCLVDFSFACAYKKYSFEIDYYDKKQDSKHFNVSIFNDPMYIEKCIKMLTPKTIGAEYFVDKQEYVNAYSNNLFAHIPVENIKTAVSLEDEWNSIFVCAELSDVYVGYWWATEA